MRTDRDRNTVLNYSIYCVNTNSKHFHLKTFLLALHRLSDVLPQGSNTVLQKLPKEHSKLGTLSHSLAETSQKKNMTTVGNAEQTMSLPRKSARPLKKRRIVSIESEEDVVASQPPKHTDSSSNSKDEENKVKRVRIDKNETKGVVSPFPSPPISPSTVAKKSVTWNEPVENIIHVQPDPSQLYPLFNENDVWYTVSNLLAEPFIAKLSIDL